MKKLLLIGCIALMLGNLSCNESFFDNPPLGQVTSAQLTTAESVGNLLTGAYALLDGNGSDRSASVVNWVFGEVTSDNAYSGGDPGNADLSSLEKYNPLPTNGGLGAKWITLYNGISRANDVLKALQLATTIDPATRSRFRAEARALRGFYYFELWKVFRNVPYIDETTTNFKTPNTDNAGNYIDIWPKIEQDFKAAADRLPSTQNAVGRFNSWAVKAFLAKAYLYQGNYTSAKPLLDALIATGTTSTGLKYKLQDCYRQVFDADTKNNTESVFAVQASVNDGNPGDNNGSMFVNIYPFIPAAGTCCGYFSPSQNLVNAFKTDADGLPLLNTFNDTDVKSDDGINSKDPFSPDDKVALDPRLDWTVGRRGIAYLDWGPHPGSIWLYNQSYDGPYSMKKFMYTQAQKKANGSAVSGQFSSTNYTVIRFADLLLLAAECEVEAGNLEKARAYVNQIRRRARDGCYVQALDGAGNPVNKPAANYRIDEYKTAWVDKAMALNAVYFERRLELALEGHRFYDLLRWNTAEPVLNAYLTKEKTKRAHLSGAAYVKGKSEIMPIPQTEIVNSYRAGQPTLRQNPGY